MVNHTDRHQLIRELEHVRGPGVRVLSLVTGDRRGHQTRIAGDIIPMTYEHLRRMGHVEEIDLFLYTPGGDTLAGWGLVNLIREYCNRLVVLVPFRCLSTGTLIVLGADEALLATGAELGPVDPSVSSPFNPPAPGPVQPGQVQLLPVSVEDLIGFIHFVKNEAGVKREDSVGAILQTLSDKVHPLALGAVYRAREQVSLLAKKLIMSHLDSEERAEAIVETLTRLPSHGYIISRNEAISVLGPDFVGPMENDLEEAVWRLYQSYEGWLELTNPYSADVILGGQDSVTRTFPRAALESVDSEGALSHVFRTVKEIIKVEVTQPGLTAPVAGIQERTIAEGWTPWPESGGNQ